MTLLQDNAPAVKDAALAQAEELFRQAWGEPEKASAREWRARESSARAMVMRGPKRGLWRDYRSGARGDVLDFVAVEFCDLSRAADDFGRVLEEAARLCGVSLEAPPDLAKLQERQRARQRAEEEAQERQSARRAALVANLAEIALPVQESPAGAYLAARGVRTFPAEAVAWLPPAPGLGLRAGEFGALVAWARDDAGRIMGGQRILLREDGTPPPLEVRKPAFGSIGGYPARFPARVEGGPLCIAEGPETALSVWLATGFETWAVFGAGQFESAPVLPGRPVVLCPDCDAPGSPAAAAFDAACRAHAARGVDLRIASAPEPPGSKRDLNDTLRRAGPEAVAEAIAAAARYVAPPPCRASDGKFTGQAALEAEPVAPPEFLPLEEAGARLEAAFCQALKDAAAWDAEGEDPAPVRVFAASPGAGKSRAMRRALAGFDLSRLAGDVVFHTPTLALADEAAADARLVGAGWHVTRGRSAINPATGEPMCARAVLAEKAARAGLSVKGTLCERKDRDPETGEKVVKRCPLFEVCAGLREPQEGEPAPSYLAQWRDLPPGPVLRFESAAYLHCPDDGSGRAVGLRIVDEKAWPGFLRWGDVRADGFTRAGVAPLPPFIRKRDREADFERRAAEAADRQEAASAVVEALQAGRSPVLSRYTAEDFEGFARAEDERPTVLLTPPSAGDDALLEELGRFETGDREAGRRAALWRILAEAKRDGVEMPERLEFRPDWRGPKGDKDPRDVIRLHWLAAFPDDAPALLLDADAAPEVVERMHPGAPLERFELRPNAEVLQVEDRTFSKGALLGKPGLRADWVSIIRAEVARDRQRPGGPRGVLVAATKEVVRAFFKDAGAMPEGAKPDEEARIMRETPLHGARWLWFGPVSLGLNEFEEFGTAIAIGREELPLQALEDLGRAMFGDAGQPLELVKPDARGRQIMPEVALPYVMADGTGRAAMVKAHPDARVRALQRMAREDGTRQFVERLRLARATERKRVILGSKVPLPGFPVDRLVKFEELRPPRLVAALLEAGGVLRLSAAGLATDAPETFPTERAAEGWIEREGGGAVNPPVPVIESYYRHGGVKPVVAEVKKPGQRGPVATRVLVAVSGDARAAVEARIGPLALWRVVESLEPLQEPAPAVERVEAPTVAPAAPEPAAANDSTLQAVPSAPAPEFREQYARAREEAPPADLLPVTTREDAGQPHALEARPPEVPPPEAGAPAVVVPPDALLWARAERQARQLREERESLRPVVNMAPGSAAARVVAAIRAGARTPGAVAVAAALGVTKTYQAIARLLEAGMIAQARDGTLSVREDVLPPAPPLVPIGSGGSGGVPEPAPEPPPLEDADPEELAEDAAWQEFRRFEAESRLRATVQEAFGRWFGMTETSPEAWA